MTLTCADCGSDAVFTLTENHDRLQLCGRCIDARLPELRPAAFTNALRAGKKVVERCPYCGTVDADVKEKGLVGCPLCYSVFVNEVWEPFGIKRTEGRWAPTT